MNKDLSIRMHYPKCVLLGPSVIFLASFPKVWLLNGSLFVEGNVHVDLDITITLVLDIDLISYLSPIILQTT